MNKVKYIFFIIVILFLSCKTVEKNMTGLAGARFNPCPPSPNCVSSMAEDKAHYIEPLTYEGVALKEVREALLRILEAEANSTILQKEADYIHAEWKVGPFIDDLEFYFPAGKKVIHLKSASRVGYSDLGENKRRVKKVRKLFEGILGT